MHALGKKPSSKVLGFRRRASDRGISKHLQILDGVQVWEIRRIRLADGKPMQMVTVSVLCEVCPELGEDALRSPLCTLIAEQSGRTPARAVEVYEAIKLDARGGGARGPQRHSGAPHAQDVLRLLWQALETSVIILRADLNRFMLKLDANGLHFSKITS